MLDAGINQAELAGIMGVTAVELSYVMRYELAVKEQNNIADMIREWDALRKRNIKD